MENIFHINEKFKIKISGDTNSSCHFLLHTTRRYCNNFAGGHRTLTGTNRQILTPERYDEHPRNFDRGVSPLGYWVLTEMQGVPHSFNFKLSRREFQDTRVCRRFKDDLLS